MAKDFRGTALRLSTYIAVSTVEFVALTMNGVDKNTAAYISFGTIVPIMIAGEVILWNKISERLPWFRISYLDHQYMNSLRDKNRNL